jgi:hypothetical protein
LIGADYKGTLPHFEISLKLRIYLSHIDLFEGKKFLVFFFGLRIFLPIQTKLFDIENQKNPKINLSFAKKYTQLYLFNLF